MDFTPDTTFSREWARSPECLYALREATERVHTAFDTIAPRRTGNLVRSTKPYPILTADGWQVDLVSNIYYARFVEHGTRYMAAQRNMQNALRIVEMETER